MSAWAKLLAICRRKSPWVYRVGAGSCNGCDIEIGPCMTPRYDAEQMGMLLQGSPKHADILLITGALTKRTHRAVVDIYAQMPCPKAVVAIGSCPAIMNAVVDALWRAYRIRHIDMPATPQRIWQAIEKAKKAGAH